MSGPPGGAGPVSGRWRMRTSAERSGPGRLWRLGTEPGPLAEAVRSGRDRAQGALERHHARRETLEMQEGFDGAAHEEAALRLAEAVEDRMRLPVSFEPPAPVPANDLPPADDPPEEVYEDYPWAGRDRAGDPDWIDDDRADGAEHDWLYQRRNGYGRHLRPLVSGGGRAAQAEPPRTGRRSPPPPAIRTRTGTMSTGTTTGADRRGTGGRKRKRRRAGRAGPGTGRTGRTRTGSTVWNSRPAMTSHDIS